MRDGIKDPSNDGFFDAPKPGPEEDEVPEPTPVKAEQPFPSINPGIPVGWVVVKDQSVTLPDSVFGFSQKMQPGAKFELDDISYTVWKHHYAGEYILVPVPTDFSFMATNLGSAASMMSAAKMKWQKNSVLDEGTGQWVPKPKKHFFLTHVKKAILYAAENGYVHGQQFTYGGQQWWIQSDPTATKAVGVYPTDLDYWEQPADTIKAKCTAGFSTWGSVLNPSPEVQQAVAEVKDDESLSKHETHTEANLFAMFDAWQQHKDAVDFDEDGNFTFKGNYVYADYSWHGHSFPIYDSKDSYPDETTWNNAGAVVLPIFQKWQEMQQQPQKPSLTQEWLWGAFEQWKADGSKQADFTYDGIKWMVGTYGLSSGTIVDGPVPMKYSHISDAPTVLSKANDIVHVAYLAWKASKQTGITFNTPPGITVNLASTTNWTASIMNETVMPTYAVPQPPFPGQKFPKWGPATGKFEQALQQALKTRLGPYATDSMVKEVTKDMLPVLKEYWDEVNAALVSLKMTAAEQDTDVPTQMPGWTPSEVQTKVEEVVPASPLKAESPTVGATKAESATAIWKSALSPYLKKQYQQRIDFGVAVGALPHGTGLDTPYIDLWIMAVKKHTKKGEPPMADAYHTATNEWEKALKGIAA